MKIKVYANMDKQYLYEEGRKAGLPEDAAEHFKFFTEVPLILFVDGENGAVADCEIDPYFLRAIR